jgi:ABC-type transporter lipoprotein component MlaA
MLLLTGCFSNSADDGDPLEGVNRVIYEVNDTLDKALIKPVAKVYNKVAPKGVRQGVTNFFDNVGYINVIANDLLQGKLRQASHDTGRFLLNSTVGVGGLLDVAGHAGMVQNDEDLGQTFGVWGAGEGAYIVLPIRGPNSVRDAPDIVTSALLNPLFYVGSTVAFPLGILNGINERANLLEATRIRDEAALDAYSFTREAYRQNREYKIYDGNPPERELEYIEEPEGVLKVY